MANPNKIFSSSSRPAVVAKGRPKQIHNARQPVCHHTPTLPQISALRKQMSRARGQPRRSSAARAATARTCVRFLPPEDLETSIVATTVGTVPDEEMRRRASAFPRPERGRRIRSRAAKRIHLRVRQCASQTICIHNGECYAAFASRCCTIVLSVFRSWAKRRMPSDSFSVAIWSSLSIQRKVFSSIATLGGA